MAETTILSQYAPRVIDVSASNDGSLTKADISAFSPATIVELKDTALAESEMYRQLTVSRLTGVKELSLYDLLLSRMTNIAPEFQLDGPKGQTYFRPYILRKQEDIVNTNNFNIVAGVEDPAAGTTVAGIAHPSHAWKLTVNSKALGKGADAKLAYQETGIKDIARYFLPQQSVVVLNLSGGAVNEPFFTIIAATSRIDSTYGEVADVIIVPNRSEAWFADVANAALLTSWECTTGIVMIGTNSVSDYESWAENEPVNNTGRLVAHWAQTCRYTRCYDDLYVDYLGKIMDGGVNEYLRSFKELPITEQNKRMYASYQKKLMTNLLYGQPIDETQTVDDYKDLPEVRDPGGNNGFIEWKSNCLGIFTQLGAADRRIDYEGAAFNIDVFEEQVYALKRHREAANGGTVDEIDFITDKTTANRFKWIMMEYYKKRTNMGWNRDFSATEKISFNQQTMWNYNSYELEGAQVTINVITEPFLSDHKAAFEGALASRGNVFAAIDWTDIELGMGAFEKRVSKTPDIDTDKDFKHIIKANISYCEMESCKLTPIVGDPNRHLVLENFGNVMPTKTVELATVTEV
jgi:hypothetical protein